MALRKAATLGAAAVAIVATAGIGYALAPLGETELPTVTVYHNPT